MGKNIDLIFSIISRINTLKSIIRVYDLIHYHYENKNIPKKFNSTREVYESQTTLYILILSYLYSFFDKSGINITEIDTTYLKQKTKNKREEIIKLWRKIENPVTRIRHNLGFHGGSSPQIKNVIKAADEIISLLKKTKKPPAVKKY